MSIRRYMKGVPVLKKLIYKGEGLDLGVELPRVNGVHVARRTKQSAPLSSQSWGVYCFLQKAQNTQQHNIAWKGWRREKLYFPLLKSERPFRAKCLSHVTHKCSFQS